MLSEWRWIGVFQNYIVEEWMWCENWISWMSMLLTLHIFYLLDTVFLKCPISNISFSVIFCKDSQQTFIWAYKCHFKLLDLRKKQNIFETKKKKVKSALQVNSIYHTRYFHTHKLQSSFDIKSRTALTVNSFCIEYLRFWVFRYL